jgi:RNA polymerase sigma factor (sigma-70 family)
MSNAVQSKVAHVGSIRAKNVVRLPSQKQSKTVEFQTEQQRKDLLVLEFRERGRKLARSILKGWRVVYELGEIDSLVDLSLCEAVQRFDTKRSVSFMTFFYYHLKGNLIKLVTNAVSKSKNLSAIDFSASDQADLQLKVRLLSAQEIADALTGQEDVSPDDSLLKKELERVRISACSKLGELERLVIERILINEEAVNDVASELGYSRCHISRVKGKALQVLRKEFECYLNK